MKRLHPCTPTSVLASLVCVGLALHAVSVSAAPVENVHSLDWYVHVDMIDAGAGRDLAFWTQLVNDRLAQATELLQGQNGPVDAGCCVTLDPISVSTFGMTGDGLDFVLVQSQLDTLQTSYGPGSFVVEVLNACAGTMSTGIRGCASSPGDFMVVSLVAEDGAGLPAVIAHERGHNAGLAHVSGNPCQLMQASNAGGCLSVSECGSFVADADTTGGSCACLDDVVGASPAADGLPCAQDSVCSGGVCALKTGLGGGQLFAAAGPGLASGATPDDVLFQSPVTGNWGSANPIGAVVTGLAYDAAGDVLYGIESQAGDDALITLDPVTGAKTGTVGTLTGREDVQALAFDPQGAGGRLFAVEVDGLIFGSTTCADLVPPLSDPCFSDLFEIDPSDASQTALGELNAVIIEDGATGLAWDDGGAVLYGTTPAGIFEVDLASCNGSACGSIPRANTFSTSGALAFDAATGQLLREGASVLGTSLLQVIDPATGEVLVSTGIDPVSPGGLAVTHVPEPGAALGLLGGSALLAALAHRERKRARCRTNPPARRAQRRSTAGSEAGE